MIGTGATIAAHQAATQPRTPLVVAEPVDEPIEEEAHEPPVETMDVVDETEAVAEETSEPSVETIEEREPERPAPVIPKLREEWRTWTSSGGHTLEARFSGLQNGNIVMLVKRDGSLARVPIEKLSADDQQLVREEVGELAEH
jgi:hypothetical protein